MECLSRANLISLAESVAREVGILGELRAQEEVHDKAPWGEFAYSDVRLSSSEEDSCPITITLFEEGDPDVTISFGGSYHEIWLLSPDKTLAVVRNFLAALMCGRYEEWRRIEGGEDARVYGRLTDGAGKVLYSDFGRVSTDKLTRRGYTRKTFRPY